ncbi:MAG: TolC family protein [Acidobacteriota bacterium]|nr:TolC family protein [Acidobacteriota bacterium]
MKRFLLLLLIGNGFLIGQEREVTFGMVIDGPSEYLSQSVIEAMKAEIFALLKRDYKVNFPETYALNSEYDLDKIKANLNRLLADEEVDMVICVGVLSCVVAAQYGDFSKPVFSPFAIGAELGIYPIDDAGTSAKANFNFVMTPANVVRDLAVMQRIKPIKSVHIVVSDLFLESIPGMRTFVEASFQTTDVQVIIVPATAQPKETLARIPDDAEMVYVTPQVRLSSIQRKEFFDGLAARKLLNFSMSGRDEVALGALSGLSPESDRVRWFRRQAINIQRVLLGEKPEDLPVLFKENAKLSINMKTARAIGWFPSWDLQIDAELLNEEPEDIGRKLTLEETVQKAVAVNPSLRAQERELELGRQEIELAKARKRPSLDADVTYLQVDSDTAANSLGNQPESSTTAQLTATQLIYSDAVNAAITIQEDAQVAREKAFEIEKLDVALDASNRFLIYLQARTLYRIQRENLDLTRSNLETAVVRRDVGIGNPAEVFRWESQLAIDRLNAITAKNEAHSALYFLNEILDFEQEAWVEAVPPNRFDPRLRTGLGKLGPYVDNAQDFERVRGFMVKEAIAMAPELAQIDALIRVREREETANRRSFYLPTVSLQAQLNQIVQRKEDPGTIAIPGIPPIELGLPEETSWNAALNFNLPLFDGGRRKANLAISRIQLEQIQLQRRAAVNGLELRVRAGMQEVATSAVAIELRNEAAEAAEKNFKLVEDSYAKGVATSIDLLDAQNSVLVARQAAANAEYVFFQALMEFQRATGQFDYFISTEDREAFFRRLDEYFSRFR